MTDKLDVLVGGQLVGWLLDMEPLAFEYSGDCLNGLLKSPFAATIALAAGPINTEAVGAYFENLLPEGDQRKSLEEQYHVTSIFGMLAAAAWDTAGAMVLRPSNAAQQKPEYIQQTWEGMATIIAGHGGPTESTKASISGAQYKILMSLDADGNPLIPVGSTPSTHILKPDINRQGQDIWASALNETLMMRTAMRCGLEVAPVRYVSVVKSCLVERYDRVNKAGDIVRINQADLCQLLKLPSTVKYEVDGGPSFADCYSYVKATSLSPIKDCERLLQWFFFNLYTGNNDSHAKNLSMLQTDDGPILAPFYDLMCTAVYPGFSRNFALKVGTTYAPGEITPEDLIAFAHDINVSVKYLRGIAANLAAKVMPALEAAIAELLDNADYTEQVMAERIRHAVSDICKRRAKRMLGVAMG